METENLENQNIILPKTNKMKNFYIILFLLLSVVIVIILIFYKAPTPGSQPVFSETLPVDYKFTTMKTNEYPSGFPKNIVVKGGVWQRGEDTMVNAGERQRIVELVYNDVDIMKLATEYEATLTKNAWKEISKTNSEEFIVYNYSKNNDTLAFIISPKGTGSLVNIKYMDK